MIDTFIFSGGGVAGISFIGVLSAIETVYDVKNIKRVIGTSSGSIMGLMISLGYTSKELQELVMNIDLSKLINITDNFCNDFLINYGIDDGSKILNLITIFLKNKFSKKDITFKELYDKFNIELVITGTCINEHKVEYFNYIDNPDMSVLKAIRISISIPFYFTTCIENKKKYVDGGIIDNYPIYYERLEKDKFIGFNLETIFQNKVDILNLQDYIDSIITCVRKRLIKNEKEFNDRTVIIQHDINIMDFNINNDEKQKLIDNGEKQTLNFLKKNNFLKEQ